jgi:hypothetical protein
MGHLFREVFYLARASDLAEGNTFSAPISLVQLREALSVCPLPTVNRSLEKLRASRAVDFRRANLSSEIGNVSLYIKIASDLNDVGSRPVRGNSWRRSSSIRNLLARAK